MKNVFVVRRVLPHGRYRLRRLDRPGPPVEIYSEVPLEVGQQIELVVVIPNQPE